MGVRTAATMQTPPLPPADEESKRRPIIFIFIYVTLTELGDPARDTTRNDVISRMSLVCCYVCWIRLPTCLFVCL